MILDSSIANLYLPKRDTYIGKQILVFFIFLFLLSCIFDPADKLFSLKLPIFVFCWVIGFWVCALNSFNLKIPAGLSVYVLLIILIPVLSIGYYFFVNGSEPYEGFQLVKAYIFISFSILLYLTRTNILEHLSIILALLAFAIILVSIFLIVEPSLQTSFYAFGSDYGVFILDARDYGSDLVMSQIYFVASPMLVVSIAYYYYLAKFSRIKKLRYWVLLILNIVAMFVAGTRNNMATALLLPMALHLFFSRKKVLSFIIMMIFVMLILLVFWGGIEALLNPSELSNSIKISLFDDYKLIFSNPVDLIFGQGLGAYHYWIAKEKYYYITELTYFEIVRNFGLLFGLLMIFMLLYPILYAFVFNKKYCEKHIIIGYAFYLVMCFTNPNMFSSMGMLILAVIMANIYIHKSNIKSRGIIS